MWGVIRRPNGGVKLATTLLANTPPHHQAPWHRQAEDQETISTTHNPATQQRRIKPPTKPTPRSADNPHNLLYTRGGLFRLNSRLLPCRLTAHSCMCPASALHLLHHLWSLGHRSASRHSHLPVVPIVVTTQNPDHLWPNFFQSSPETKTHKPAYQHSFTQQLTLTASLTHRQNVSPSVLSQLGLPSCHGRGCLLGRGE